ncbi:MAG: hypothetical protein LQ348_007434 [Seirophora lacunosa]|nr:MAG: hypothetical protein LQ348_007434 [Seirophora lacunosa]
MESDKTSQTVAKLQSNVETTSIQSPHLNYEDGLQPQKGSTRDDVLDMSRMGKRQELQLSSPCKGDGKRRLIRAAYYGLTNGGTGGVIWVTVGVILGALCMIASIGGMASMAPTAGGQCGYFSYFLLIAKEQIIDGRESADHWVSELAPKSVEKPLSCIVGWLALLGWVTGCPAAALRLPSSPPHSSRV